MGKIIHSAAFLASAAIGSTLLAVPGFAQQQMQIQSQTIGQSPQQQYWQQQQQQQQSHVQYMQRPQIPTQQWGSDHTFNPGWHNSDNDQRQGQNGYWNVQTHVYPNTTIHFYTDPGPSYPYPWNSPYPAYLPNPYAPQYTAPGVFSPFPTTPYYQPPVVSYGPPPCYYPYYCPSDYGNYVYQSVYGLYIGFPGYIYGPQDVVVLPGPTTVFDPSNGTWYSYDGSDPYYGGAYSASALARQESSRAGLPQRVRKPFDDIAQSWSQHDMTSISQYVPGNGKIDVGMNGSYAYSIDPNAYKLMTRDAMQRLQTTDFRFTGIDVQPNGDARGYAVQSYRAPTGDLAKMYAAYTLHPDTSQAGGYRIVRVDSSTHPFALQARALSNETGNSIGANTLQHGSVVTYHN